jgi:acetolactate synthase-1/2/3 large subunit
MTFAELMTAVQEGVKVNIAIINNGYLGMVRQWQAMFYEGRYAATPILSPDFVKLADAFGIPGQRVGSRAEVAGAVARAREAKGAALIEFKVEQEDSVYPMVPAGAALHDMIRRPSAQSALAETGSDPV